MAMNYDDLERILKETDAPELYLQYENPGAISGIFVGGMNVKNPFYKNVNADFSNFISVISLAKAKFRDVSLWTKGVCIAHIKTWFDMDEE
jgi:hypothetical protein